MQQNLDSVTDPIIRDAIVVIIIITSITDSILIVIFLSRVREIGTVVLSDRKYDQPNCKY